MFTMESIKVDRVTMTLWLVVTLEEKLQNKPIKQWVVTLAMKHNL